MQNDLEIYELLYLVDPYFPLDELEKKVNFYAQFLMDRGSEVMIQNRGKRNLSYKIRNFDNANYIQMTYVGNQKLTNSINLVMRRDEAILRALTTKVVKPAQLA